MKKNEKISVVCMKLDSKVLSNGIVLLSVNLSSDNIPDDIKLDIMYNPKTKSLWHIANNGLEIFGKDSEKKQELWINFSTRNIIRILNKYGEHALFSGKVFKIKIDNASYGLVVDKKDVDDDLIKLVRQMIKMSDKKYRHKSTNPREGYVDRNAYTNTRDVCKGVHESRFANIIDKLLHLDEVYDEWNDTYWGGEF